MRHVRFDLINDEPFMNACCSGSVERVQELLKNSRVDPSEDNSFALRVVAERGFAPIVKLLLDDGRSKPQACNNQAIKSASRWGRTEVVKHLLADERVSPQDGKNISIDLASIYGHKETVMLLYRDQRVKQALNELSKDALSRVNTVIRKQVMYSFFPVVAPVFQCLFEAEAKIEARVQVKF